MSRQRFPLFADQPGLALFTFAIDGSEVGATSGSAGLDGRGKNLATIKKLNNVVTIDWLVSYAEAPYVVAVPGAGQANTQVEITTNTASQLVLTTTECDDNTAPVNDADLYVVVFGYNTTSYVS